MTLSAVEQTKFRAHVAYRLLRELEILIPEYIHTNPYLIEDIEDKGYDTIEEAYFQNVSNLTFNWS